MLRYFAPLLLLGLLIVACASPPEAVPGNGANQALRDESQLITAARTDITIGSPDSLRRAISDLDASDARESEVGRDLLYLASNVYLILYPLLDHPAVDIVPPPATSTYSKMITSIKAGIYPEIPPGQASFITLIVPTLTVFYSTSVGVEERASQALAQAVTLNPDSVVPFLVQGVLAERRRELGNAYLFFDAALKVSPSCYPARYGLARTGHLLGKNEEAYRSVTLLKTTFPGNIEFLNLSTQILFDLGRYAEADKENQEALKLEPDNLNSLLLRIRILEVLGTNDPYAKRLLSRIEQQLPQNPEVMRMTMRFLIKDGELERALPVAERAHSLFPDDNEFEKTYGKLLIDTGRIEEGRQVIENTLEDDPDSIDKLEILLSQAEEEKNWARAGEYVQRILELDRSPEYLRRAVDIYTAYGRYVTAVGFAAMLSDKPEVTATDLMEYAGILVTLGQTAQARGVLNDALEIAQNGQVRSVIYYTLSTIADTPEERYAALQDSLFEDPQNRDTLVGYSDYFETLGDYNNARKWLGRAVDLLPEGEGEELRSHLAELEEIVGE
ncbi:MAG: hypothetical protein JW852_03125 [Spirochaetales bacterium]|nr:hypothetical protein [Spirochaetales bacterium]